MTLRYEQQPRETSKAYAAFKTYLDMGSERSLSKTAKAVGKKQRLIEHWSSRWDWQGRLASYREHTNALERRAIEALAIEKAVEWGRIHEAIKMQEWERHRKLIALADKVIQRWEAEPEKIGTLEGLVRLYELAGRLARLAAGMPSEVKEIKTQVTGRISMDWEVAIRKVFGNNQAPVLDVEEVKPLTNGDKANDTV